MKKPMRFSVLASGSRGNACYIESETTRIIIDAGISCREMERRLSMIGVGPRGIDAILITHEHSDHIRGAGPLVRRYGMPLYINQKTYQRSIATLGRISEIFFVDAGKDITIKDITIKAFTKCHDAVDPMGFVVSSNGTSLGLATDLGRSTRLVEDHLKGCDALILEFNHDIQMLDEGPYPLDVKRRIKGPDGHLSNHQAAELLKEVCGESMKCVVLAHLSGTNNIPEKAFLEAEAIIKNTRSGNARIMVGAQDEPGPLLSILL